ncbi:G1 family glutamic endopeptidase [Streptomyces olivochromogenes]|uniref:G1 family glutamic endopeptidase n=1 Tax=Streptomyces olivochromogenes TaxID=1963 RepID=UPI001F17D838|nr:G1 family glutamic endopeptidase [Streptomyces olivochromogenes]MCF3134159.1 hypothetical protein [Streptomyces olivochromogenes]
MAISDPDGYLEFSVRPLGKSTEIARLHIDAATDSQGAQHLLEIRSSNHPTPDMPTPPERPRPLRGRGVRTSPPLGLDECLSLSDEEIFERGYPLRPNPDVAPMAFNSWRRFVSAPVTFVEPQIASRPDIARTHRKMNQNLDPQSLQESDNWSGYQLIDEPGTYDWVYAEWHLPGAGAGPFNPHTYNAFWVGLDGTGTRDLVQAGTEGNGIVDGTLCTSTFFAWTALLPEQWAAQQITNFPLRIGDNIQCAVQTANSEADVPSIGGALAIFSLANERTHQYTRVTTPRKFTEVSGSQADWIMERPTVNGGHSDLATYNTATMKFPLADRENPLEEVGYLEAPNDQITMVSQEGRTLSTVTPIDNDTMQFTWHNFK